VLTERLAPLAAHLHAIELDRRLEPQLAGLAARPDVTIHWADAMKLDLAALDPAPTAMVANLPYSVATPLILRTIELLPGLRRWTLMVQREIADRLRAPPGSRTYGSATVLAQLAAEVTLLRAVDPAVFKPRPRVESAVLGLRRLGPAAPPAARTLVREAFAHRRKSLARSLELARPGRIESVREALTELGRPADARAEALSPQEFLALSAKLGG
jgi:16S rRNA (adenine1518-N6/adenine1519-N6)-dimethyltransferase